MKPLWPRVVLIGLSEEHLRAGHQGVSLDRCRFELSSLERRMNKGLQRDKEASRLVTWMDQARNLALMLMVRQVVSGVDVPRELLEAWYRSPRSDASSMFFSPEQLRQRVERSRAAGVAGAQELAGLIEQRLHRTQVWIEVVV